MALDTITREQFQLYRTVEQKEGELRQYVSQVKGNVLGIVIGLPFSIGVGSSSFKALENGSYVQAVVYGLFSALFALGGVGYGVRELVKGYSHEKVLKSEINALKSDPQYKALI